MSAATAALVAILFAVVLTAQGQAPGFAVALSQDGLTVIKDVAVQQLLAQLTSIAIPDQSGQASTPVGSVSYDLKNIVLSGLSLPGSAITLDAPDSITVSVSGGACVVNCDWSFRENAWPHASDSGGATVSVGDLDVTVVVAIGLAAERPTVSVSSCSLSMGSFSVQVHGGGPDWLVNWLVGLFQGSIKSAVESATQAAIVSAINGQAEQALASLPIVERVDAFSSIDFGMLAVPVITPSLLASQHLGQFLCNDNACPPSPWSPVPLPDSVTSDQINVIFSEEVANSAGYVYWAMGALQTTVDSVPATWPIQLTTNDFAPIIPLLYETYPNADMSFVLTATSPPVATINATGGAASVDGVATVYVHPHNTSAAIEVFTLGLVIFGSGSVGVNENNITANVRFVSTSLTLINSTIGSFQVEVLQEFVDFACEEGLVPWLNKELGVGFVIPTVEGVSLSSIQVVYGEGFVAVGADLAYNPSAPSRIDLLRRRSRAFRIQ